MVFDFVGENWRLWFKLMIYFLLPFSVLLGSTFATFYNENDTPMPDIAYVMSAVLFILCCAVVTALEILLVKWYETHNFTLEGCDVGTMWRMISKPSLKCLGIIVLWTPLVALALMSIVIPIIGFVVMFAMLPVFLMCPIMLLEPENTFTGIVSRAFSLGYKKWGSLILVAVVMGIVGAMLNNAITFPLGIFVTFQTVLDFSPSDSAFWSFIIDVFFYIMCVAECFMIFVELGLFVLAMTYHYGSVAAEVEDIGLESDIDDFANLK